MFPLRCLAFVQVVFQSPNFREEDKVMASRWKEIVGAQLMVVALLMFSGMVSAAGARCPLSPIFPDESSPTDFTCSAGQLRNGVLVNDPIAKKMYTYQRMTKWMVQQLKKERAGRGKTQCLVMERALIGFDQVKKDWKDIKKYFKKETKNPVPRLKAVVQGDLDAGNCRE